MPALKKTTFLVVLVALLALPATATASKRIRVGLGDQQASMFEHPAFEALRIKRVRYFIRWDAMRHPDELAAAERYVRAARAKGATVLMHISSDNLTRKKARLPKLATYRSRVTALIRHFRRLGVREWGARNEANHDSQATWRSPRRAAQEFRIVRRACPGCTIVALDVLDQAGVERYIRRFYQALGSYRRYARIVGIHNYSDVNRRRTRGTRAIIRTVRRHGNGRTRFWLTETGGVVKLGRSWPYSRTRAAARLTYLFSTLRGSLRRDIDRVYVYNWTGAERTARFDAGITNPDGSTRPGYTVLRQQLSRFAR
jgi:hypothetical protein